MSGFCRCWTCSAHIGGIIDAAEMAELVVGSAAGGLACDNVGWGARRIVGELKKLAVRASRSSVRRVLVDENKLPDPDRHALKGVQTPCRKFIAIHMGNRPLGVPKTGYSR